MCTLASLSSSSRCRGCRHTSLASLRTRAVCQLRGFALLGSAPPLCAAPAVAPAAVTSEQRHGQGGPVRASARRRRRRRQQPRQDGRGRPDSLRACARAWTRPRDTRARRCCTLRGPSHSPAASGSCAVSAAGAVPACGWRARFALSVAADRRPHLRQWLLPRSGERRLLRLPT